MTSLDPIATRPDSLAEMVYAAIREAIVTRRMAPGEQLTESSIATQLQVSKTPVREALLKLEYVGMIETGDWRGLRVVMPSRDAIRRAYEVRMGLELQAVRILAEGDVDADLDTIRAIAEECFGAAEACDREGFRTGDRRFHLTLAEATENPLLKRFIRDSFDLTWALRRRDVPDPDGSLECAAQHLTIVDALLAGDAAGAETAMRKHLQKVKHLVLSAFDASDDS